MSPLEYLRRRKPPLPPQERQLFLETCAAVDAGIRAARTPVRAPAGETTACGCCWPQYLTCRRASHSRTGA